VEGREGPGVGVLDQVLRISRIARHPHGGAVELIEIGQGVGLEARGTLLIGLALRSPVEVAGTIGVDFSEKIGGRLAVSSRRTVGARVVSIRHRPRA
jgi:hypothetical protein